MASLLNILRIGNLIRYRRHASAEYLVGLIVALDEDEITIYRQDSGCISISMDNKGVIELLSRPYSKVV